MTSNIIIIIIIVFFYNIIIIIVVIIKDNCICNGLNFQLKFDYPHHSNQT
jgi:hypothetical protein